MANSIFKLKVETSEYDQKLANAAKGIRHLADVAHQSGGELTGLEKAELDYIRALGDMETKSRTASGQVRELSNTYKELKVVYDQLNEVEKADEGGKALAASLETLKQRAQEAKAQLDTATLSLNDNGQSAQQSSGILEVLKDKFTINIDALTLFNKGLQVAEVALNVAKDAFFASEATVDEWGRVVDSSKSLYEGFLTALNTGDISGYLGRIDEIVTAARKAYDELDRLGTMKTIQAPKMSAQQTENERMRMMIQTGRYIAPVDGRRASMKDGQLLTPEQIRRIEAQLQNGMKSVVTLVGNEVRQTGKAIDAVYNRQAQELGMSLKEFRKGTSSMAEFDKRMAGYDQYQKWREQHTTIDMQSGREIVARGNPFEQFAKWGTFRVDGQRYNDLVRLIQQRDQQAAQAYGMQSQAYRTMNRAEGVTVSKLMKGGATGGTNGRGGKGGKTITEEKDDFVEINGLINMAAERVSDLQRRIREAPSESMITELREQLKDAQAELDRLNGKWQDGLQATFKFDDSDVLEKLRDIEGVTIDPKTLTVTANTAEAYNQVQQLLESVDGKTVTFTVQPKMETGTSIQNDAGMSAYIASIKHQLETADYGTSLYNGLSAQLADMTTLQNLVGASLKAGLGTSLFDVTDETGADFWTRAMEGGVENIDWQAIADKINEARKAAGLDAISLDFTTGSINTDKGDKNGKRKKNQFLHENEDGKQEAKVTEVLGGLAGGMQQMIGGLEQLGIDIPAGLQNVVGGIQLVSTILTSIMTIVSAIEAISAADAIIPFANGGIVPKFAGGGLIGKAAGGMLIPGNSFSGDNLRMPVVGGGMIGVNSGEVILNQAQAGVIANALEGGGMQNLQLEATIRGEDIKLALNNNSRRTGRGEYVTTRFKQTQ